MNLFAILLVSSAFGGMNGGCGDYKDVRAEMKLWETAPTLVKSGNRPFVEAGKRLALSLEDQKTVRFPVPPEKLMIKNGTAFAGIFTFKPTAAGAYRVALAKRAWLDVIDAGTNALVKSSGFEMQTGCDKMVKVVSYNLDKGKTYLIQINSSPEQTLDATVVMEK